MKLHTCRQRANLVALITCTLAILGGKAGTANESRLRVIQHYGEGFLSHDNHVSTLAFLSGTGQLLTTVQGKPSVLYMWRYESPKTPPKEIALHEFGTVRAMIAGSDGRSAILTDGTRIGMYASQSGLRIVKHIESPLRNPELCVSCSGRFVVCWSRLRSRFHRRAMLIDTVSGKLVSQIEAAAALCGAGVVEHDGHPLLVALTSTGVLHLAGPGIVDSARQLPIRNVVRCVVSPTHLQIACSVMQAAEHLEEGADPANVIVISIASGGKKPQSIRTIGRMPMVTAFSFDGARLGIATRTGFEFWDLESQKLVCEIDHVIDGPVELSHDASAVAFSGTGHRIGIFEVAPVKDLAPATAHASAVGSLCWTMDGQVLVSGADDIRHWRPDHPVKVIRLPSDRCRVTGLSLSANGEFLAAATYESNLTYWTRTSALTIWNRTSGFQVYRHSQGDDAIYSIRLTRFGCVHSASCDGAVAECLYDGGVLRSGPDWMVSGKWNLESGEELDQLVSNEQRVAVFVRSAERDPECRVYNLKDGRIVGKFLPGLKGRPTVGCMTADGRIIVGDTTGTVTVFNHAVGSASQQFVAHDTEVVSLSVAESTELLATVGTEGEVRLWDLQASKAAGRIKTASRVSVVEFSPDQSKLACGHRNGTLSIWEAKVRDALEPE